jgi:cupin fold WbuC family metalloprotein
MDGVEKVVDAQGLEIAMVIRAGFSTQETRFLTQESHQFQLGFIVYKAGSTIPCHTHLPIPRSLVGTSEAILVRQGRAVVMLFDTQRVLITEMELRVGDLIVLYKGGHGFRLLEDTVLMEIKQGPYIGLDEKQRFDMEAL